MESRKACSFATEAVCSLKVTEHFVPWETIIAIAMTESSAGSDLQGVAPRPGAMAKPI